MPAHNTNYRRTRRRSRMPKRIKRSTIGNRRRGGSGVSRRSHSRQSPQLQLTPVEALYSPMSHFLPGMNKDEFLRVFAKFIETTDFTEFLKTIPSGRDIPSIDEMKSVMKQIARELKLKTSINGVRFVSTPAVEVLEGGDNKQNQNGQTGGDLFSDSHLYMMTIVFAFVNLVTLRRQRPVYIAFYIALVIFYFWSLTIYVPRGYYIDLYGAQVQYRYGEIDRRPTFHPTLLSRILPVAIAAPIPINIIRSIAEKVFYWLGRLISPAAADDDHLMPQSRVVVPPRRRSLFLTPSDELANLANIPQTNASLPYSQNLYHRPPRAASPM